MNLYSIASSAADVARGISGIRYAYPTEVETIPATPAVVVGMAGNATVIPGDRQVTGFQLPVRLYVEAVSDIPRNVQTIYGYVNTFVATYALHQGLAGTVQQAYITAWETDRRYLVGGAEYHAIDFTLTVGVHEQVTQSL